VEYRLLRLPTCEENKHLGLVTAIADAIEDFKINRCAPVRMTHCLKSCTACLAGQCR
jgi:hypothetical protein